MTTYDLETTYLSLAPEGEVAELPVGPDFWATIGSNPKLRGALVSAYRMDADWAHWEMHPHGDEVRGVESDVAGERAQTRRALVRQREQALREGGPQRLQGASR